MKEVERLKRQAAHYGDLAKFITDVSAQQAAKEVADRLRREAEERAARLRRDQRLA